MRPWNPFDWGAERTVARQQLLFVVLCLVWGTTWLALKVGVTAVPPAFFSGTRWTVAGVALLAWRRWQGQRLRLPHRALGRAALVGVLMVALNAVLMLYGLRYVSSGLAAVISSALTPIALLGFSVAFGHETFRPRQLAAIGLGVLGIGVLFGPAAAQGRLGLGEALGAAGVIAGTLCYTLGSVRGAAADALGGTGRRRGADQPDRRRRAAAALARLRAGGLARGLAATGARPPGSPGCSCCCPARSARRSST